MTSRVRVTENRKGSTRRVVACSFKAYVTVNFYENGKPSEVFMTISKHGSIIAGFARALAVLLSVLLQYGAPWEVIYGKLSGMKFDPYDEKYNSLVDAFTQTINEIVKEKERDLNDACGTHDKNL